jgi:uncharacterized 2Fe-2S/4Fe-4S cluster protein (DUF4445 family)
MPVNESPPVKFTVNMQPIGRRVEIAPGMTLLEAAQSAGVELSSVCGGVGVCESCQVRLIEGDLTPPTLEEESLFSSEELAQGYRLACQAAPIGDVKIDIPPESLTTPQRLQIEGQSVRVPPSPVVQAYDLDIDPPSLHDLRADTSRMNDALRAAGLDTSPTYNQGLLKDISPRLRDLRWATRAVLRGDEVISLLPKSSPLAGLAVDVGTTKLAAYLVNLSTGDTLSKTGAMNPQIAFGEDVISRIAYTEKHEDGREVMQLRLVESLNLMLARLCQGAGFQIDQVVDAVVVGNTVMHHLFAGLPVSQLGHSPFVPAVSEAFDLQASDLDLELALGGRVHLPPNIAGYVGADHVAMLLATDAWQATRTTLALDIGTNTEVSLKHGDRLLCCSCASGPAFEGAHIRDGMRAAPGAIERVQIREAEQRIQLQTIGDQPPVGICGSGILEAISEMLKSGVLDPRGALRGNHPLVRKRDGLNEFVLAEAKDSGHGRDVLVTRRDVNEIQLAKGAIRAGIEILLAESGISAEAIEDFIIAGAFGTYISVPSAIQVGMFPPLPEERYRQVGNAAGAGARQMLVSTSQREIAQEIAHRVEYVELSSHPNFTNEFSHRLFFPDVE